MTLKLIDFELFCVLANLFLNIDTPAVLLEVSEVIVCGHVFLVFGVLCKMRRVPLTSHDRFCRRLYFPLLQYVPINSAAQKIFKN